MSHLLWKHREYAISTCFCPSEVPSFSVPIHHTLIFSRTLKWKGYVLESMGCTFSSTSHFYEATLTLFYWATILLDWSALILNVTLAVSAIICQMTTSAIVSFSRGSGQRGRCWNQWSSVHLSFLSFSEIKLLWVYKYLKPKWCMMLASYEYGCC